MPLIYCDPVNGNDANSGLTFALRKKTLNSASLVAGSNSEIRIIKSPEPTVLGTCSWTDNSNTVTIPTGTVANIENCESGWTASTNVTNTYSTTRKEGTYSLSMAVGAAFTTGKAAYKAVSMDLTGYQQLSFWVRQASGTVATAGQVSIKLCSDTTGDTPVHSFDVPKLGATGYWHCFTVDLGSGMGAISSIGIYLNSDLGAQTFLFDNIIASKAPSAADSLSLVSLISKGTGDEPWLPICSITDTSLKLDCGTNNASSGTSSYGNYAGVTESVTSYKRETLKTPIGSSAFDINWGNLGNSGLTISGGWNETDMSTQSGETYLDGTGGLSCGIVFQSAGAAVTKVSLVRYGTAIYFGSGYNSTSSGSFTGNDINGNTTAFTYSVASTNFTLNVKSISNNQGATRLGATGGGSYNSYNGTWTAKNINGNSGNIILDGVKSAFNLDNVKYNMGALSCGCSYSTGTFKYVYGVASYAAVIFYSMLNSNFTFQNEIKNASYIAIAMPSGAVTENTVVDLTGCAVTGGIVFSAGYSTSGITFIGGTLTGTALHTDSEITWIGTTFGTAPAFSAGYKAGRAICQDYNGVAGDVRIFDAIGNIQTATDQRQTGTGYSWKFSPNSYTTSAYPLELELAKLPISAESITFSIYIRRTDSSSTASIIAKKGQLGLTSDVISSSTVTGSWEKVTLTVTPTVQGVLTLHMQVYGTTPVWFDTFGVQE